MIAVPILSILSGQFEASLTCVRCLLLLQNVCGFVAYGMQLYVVAGLNALLDHVYGLEGSPSDMEMPHQQRRVQFFGLGEDRRHELALVVICVATCVLRLRDP